MKSSSALHLRAATFALGLMLISPAVGAERKIGQKPLPGTEIQITVGSALFERFNIVADAAPRLRDDFELSLGIQGKVAIASGTSFKVIRAKPLKVCTVAQDTYIDSFVGPRGAACLYDDDMDGTFDKASAETVLFTTKKIKQPVPYDWTDTPANAGSDYFKQTLTYLGGTGNVLRLSYREFSHDMARPAFTEELSFPLDAAFPQTIAWRDVHITLISLDRNGLRYRIEPKQ